MENLFSNANCSQRALKTFVNAIGKVKDTVTNYNENNACLLIPSIFISDNCLESYSKLKLKGYNVNQILCFLCSNYENQFYFPDDKDNFIRLKELIKKLIEDGAVIYKSYVISSALYSNILLFKILYEIRSDFYDEEILQICVQNNFAEGVDFMIKNIKFNKEVINKNNEFAKTCKFTNVSKIFDEINNEKNTDNIDSKINALFNKLNDEEKEVLKELLKNKDKQKLDMKELMNQFIDMLGTIIKK